MWNEPNLQLFLTPQFVGKKIVSPANYAKLYKAAYAGIKAGQPARAGRDRRDVGAGPRQAAPRAAAQTVAPGNVREAPRAGRRGSSSTRGRTTRIPTSPNLPPTQKVRYPNVTLSTMPKFEKDLQTWFHRTVPIWITEYGHETKPGEPHGVSFATQAAYAKQALAIAKKDPNVQMFIWFTFRDSTGNPWQSGLFTSGGSQKPAYAAFGSVARLTDGSTFTVKAGTSPRVTMYVPYLGYYSEPGAQIGMTYTCRPRTADGWRSASPS